VNVREALAEAERRLTAARVETPGVDAEWLVAHVLGTTRSGLAARGDDEVDGLDPLLARREAREPLAYILGEWGFRRLTLKTDARALVPRPETETLVERALALVAELEAPRILDVGVGSGAIALALKDERPDAVVAGVDISPDALALARENAERLGLDVDLRERDGVEAAAEGWDLVVANPPYVESLDGLQAELHWEPEVALIGTGSHERLARAADARFLAFEVGDGQAIEVAATLTEAGWRDVRITPDLTGAERVVEGAK
jgi:release factor glutamine methyltransferase